MILGHHQLQLRVFPGFLRVMPDINTNLLVGRHGHAQGLPCVQAAKPAVYVARRYAIMHAHGLA